MSLPELLREAARQWEWIAITLSGVAILVSVAVKFAVKADDDQAPKERERSVVATLTMTAFFLAVFVLARRGVGRIELTPGADLAARIIGTLLVVGSAVMNIAARAVIGRQWSDAIEIQREHELIRTWPYSWSRHPMYGSLVVFGVGLGIAARNPLVLLAVLLVFVPAMVHRARREEAMLLASFGDEYRAFMRGSSRLIPRLPESISVPLRAGIGILFVAAVLTREPQIGLLAALLVLGLSFAMARSDFRMAWKLKAGVAAGCALAAAWDPRFLPLLWIPALTAAVSLSGHCPGTLLLRSLDGKAPHVE